MKEILAIDIDDVLAANAEGFVSFSNERWGTSLKPEDYDEHWAEVWRVDEEETEKRAVELVESGAVGRYKHIAEAESVLRKLHDKYTIHAVTSRRRTVEKETIAWIESHFSGMIDEISFAGFYDDPSQIHNNRAKTKADILKEIGASYLIDDQLKHCLGAAQIGIDTILFGDYKWNQTHETLPVNVTRCKDWAEVDQYFLSTP